MSDLPDPDVLKGIPPETLRNLLSCYHSALLDLIAINERYCQEKNAQQWVEGWEQRIARFEAERESIVERIAR